MKPYVDTNFLTHLYLELPAEAKASRWKAIVERRNSTPFSVTWLQRAEVCNAMQLYVFRSQRGISPRISPEFSSAAWAQFREDLRTGKLRATDISASDLVEQAEGLSLKHTARHGFRAYDLLHVASALLLGCDSFWSFDEKAARLAKLEGLSLIAGKVS